MLCTLRFLCCVPQYPLTCPVFPGIPLTCAPRHAPCGMLQNNPFSSSVDSCKEKEIKEKEQLQRDVETGAEKGH